jgi:hypothetical protein
MKKIRLLSLITASFILLAFINGCGGKSPGSNPAPPNPCAGKTITVAGTVTNTATGQSVGAINATASGSSNFTYNINGGSFQASGNFTGLAVGSYTIIAKDGDGCTGSNSFVVNDPCTIKNISITGTVVNTGAGQSTGSITATAAGSTGFTYQLNGGAFQATGTFTGLAIGTYTITVKDTDGCTKSQTFSVVDICSTKAITITGTVVNTSVGQSTGSITATAAGSTGFTYQLNGGAFQATGTFTGLAIGIYTVTSKDIDGCLTSQNFSVLDICSAKNITVTATVVNAGPASGASNGSITATANGSTGFTYQLNNGAFQASGIFTGLTAGNYTVTAKDVDNCTKSQSFTVTLDPCIGKNLTISATTTGHDKCSVFGTGTITITASGGTGFTYSLNGGAFQASNIFTGLAPNTYTIAAKDADGCIKTGNATVSQGPAGINFSAVRTILQNNCALSGCHSGPAPTGGLNFTEDCTIVGSWDRIKARAVDGNPSTMPPPPNTPLSASDKQKILDWIAAGHRYTD